jgi:hypothetical protein
MIKIGLLFRMKGNYDPMYIHIANLSLIHAIARYGHKTQISITQILQLQTAFRVRAEVGRMITSTGYGRLHYVRCDSVKPIPPVKRSRLRNSLTGGYACRHVNVS